MIFLFFLLIIIFIDQTIKYLVYTNIKGFSDLNIIGNLLKVVYVKNKGAAFGILKDSKYFLIFITLIIISVISIWSCIRMEENNSSIFNISCCLIIGGSIGNLIDRLFLGYVIDYIQLSIFPPVCNISDYCIFIGAVLLSVYIIFISDSNKNMIQKHKG